ncbi:ribonuclease H-like domain-containing protein, partial [Lentinula raphanica]
MPENKWSDHAPLILDVIAPTTTPMPTQSPARRPTIECPLRSDIDQLQHDTLHATPPSLLSQQLNLFGHATPDLSNRSPLKLYSDGSCLNACRPDARAGSGVYFGNPQHPLNLSVRVTGLQTNNRAELYAILVLLQKTSLSRALEIYADSEYAIRSIVYRSPSEAQSNWSCPNGDLLQRIAQWIKARRVPLRFHHVKAHSNNQHNDAADKLAKSGA